MTDAPVVRRVTDPNDAALDEFGAIQRAVYYDQGSLIPPEWFGRLLEDAAGARINFLIVAERNGHVLGGALFHYLAEADSGFSSFMGVAHQARGQGISRALHRKRFEVLNEAAGHAVPGVFIDVVNPTRMDEAELAAEDRVGMDPFSRLKIFQHLGFGRVDIRYEQPVGGPNGGPVTRLDLLYCPQRPADTIPTAYVVATLRAYWSGWLG
ncbi:MAG: GNAT family N-acetyltransferase, partial [Chloroflexi bacterium]|nr:GNAT family N-acetyltransferase [Chloroflexota bacterium]